jgi:hypothetical protein
VRIGYVLSVAILVAVAGWWGLYQFTTRVWPEEPGAQLSFFALLFVTLAATLAPAAAVLNHRFAAKGSKPGPGRFLRHSVWGGLCLTSFAWLQSHGAMNLGFAFVIILIFVAIEVFMLRMGSEA